MGVNLNALNASISKKQADEEEDEDEREQFTSLSKNVLEMIDRLRRRIPVLLLLKAEGA